jgi:hypothetical protein
MTTVGNILTDFAFTFGPLYVRAFLFYPELEGDHSLVSLEGQGLALQQMGIARCVRRRRDVSASLNES